MEQGSRRVPTIMDIAAKSGLSKSVVSRALNGEAGVSPKSRELVLSTATDLGYVANTLAQRMRSQRVDTIGVFVRDPASPFYGALLGATQAVARGRGVRLVTMTGAGEPDISEEREALQALLALRVDGLMVCSGVLPAETLASYAERVPTVVVGRNDLPPQVAGASCDDRDGTLQVVDHLLGLGHRDVLVPLVPAERAPSLHTRGEMVLDALRLRGLDPLPVAVTRHADLIDVVRQASATAVVAPNDRWAVTLLEDPPHGGLSVTGYDGVGVYGSSLLGLTTLAQPIGAIAQSALSLVLDRLVDGHGPEHVRVRGTLRVGRSTHALAPR